MKSTLLNMTAVLFGITLVASAGVGVVNMITIDPIEQAKAADTENAVKAVLNGVEFDAIAPADTLINKNNCPVIVYRATKQGEPAAYAVKAPSITKNGFNGKVTLMVGYTPDGVVNDIAVVEQNETPGLGTRMKDEGNPLYLSVQGKNTWEMRQRGKLAVNKDGGEVDALTAATISSRAYVNAIETADAAFRIASGQVESGETSAVSGATLTDECPEQAQQSANEPEAQEGGQNE